MTSISSTCCLSLGLSPPGSLSCVFPLCPLYFESSLLPRHLQLSPENSSAVFNPPRQVDICESVGYCPEALCHSDTMRISLSLILSAQHTASTASAGPASDRYSGVCPHCACAQLFYLLARPSTALRQLEAELLRDSANRSQC